jgi:hypothetical protein
MDVEPSQVVPRQGVALVSLAVAILFSSCSSTANSAADGDASFPTLMEVTCADGSASVWTPTVAALRDGVHVEIENASADASKDPVHALSLLDVNIIPGVHTGDRFVRLGYPEGSPSILRVLVERGGRSVAVLDLSVMEGRWFYEGHEATCVPPT